MADLSADIEFTFMEPPAPTEEEGVEGMEWPRVMVDIEGVEPIIQPLVLLILYLVHKESV